MGNYADSGFTQTPQSYLRVIRKQTTRQVRDIAVKKGGKPRRESVAPIKREVLKVTGIGLTEDNAAKYLISNPAFLDDFIHNHVSQSRVKAWLKESKDRKDRSEKEEDDFTAELMERSFRHRQILLITRSRLLYPFRYDRDELNELIERAQSNEYENDIDSHLFPYTEVPTEDINKVFIFMANKLLGKHAFPMPELCYFLSAMKANYLNVEYHNYHHALSLAQSMYWIIRKNPGIFTELEIKCLLVSALAHDVGHPGVNENFLKATGGGLEKLYNSPILENHHVQTTFLILQDINCNVFCNVEGDEYKQVLDEIQHAILSTSLNRYKVQCENMRHIIATDLNLTKKAVRDAAKSVMMMTCDLCASWKSWQEHKTTVWSLYKEFFSQGDKEMSLQIDSVPQMMRMNADKIPTYQIFFLENVIIPVFQIQAKIFPNIGIILETTGENLELWKTYV